MSGGGGSWKAEWWVGVKFPAGPQECWDDGGGLNKRGLGMQGLPARVVRGGGPGDMEKPGKVNSQSRQSFRCNMRSQSAALCLAAAERTRGFIKFLLAHRSPNSGRRRHLISPFTLPPSFALSSTIPQRRETPLLIHLLPARVTGNSSFLDSFYSFVMLSFTVANPPPILSYRSFIIANSSLLWQ